MIEVETTKKKIRDILDAYENTEGGGIVGYGGKLDIRPQYQREYIHENNRNFKSKLIQSIYNQLPIGLIYWAEKEDGTYELLDGQQRIITIGEFVVSNNVLLTIGDRDYLYSNLDDNQRKKILDYESMICICKGSYNDKMNWFKTINTGSEQLSDQELRNAIYSGTWVTDAKRHFTKNNRNKVDECNELMGSHNRNRQAHLEKVICWKIGSKEDDEINTFMANHQNNPSAQPLWDWYRNLLEWVHELFGETPKIDRKERATINWGELYGKYRNKDFNTKKTRNRFQELFQDETIENKKGIYDFILSGETRLNLLDKRNFDGRTKKQVWLRQEKKCKYNAKCNSGLLKLSEVEADHVVPYSKGGRTLIDNCEILCVSCNREKWVNPI